MPGSQKFSSDFSLRVFDVCLEICDSKNYFGFVVDEFFKRKRDSRDTVSKPCGSRWFKRNWTHPG